MRKRTLCSVEDCTEVARSRGKCENHYRESLRRERGIGGIEPYDDVIYKIRLRTPRGTQPFYFSKPERAASVAAQAKVDGTLLFYGEYKLERKMQ